MALIQLQANYRPHKFDVICAKGKEAKNHTGNVFYRNLITQVLPRYFQASSKLEKTIIVSEIVDTIRSLSPDGGFIKREKFLTTDEDIHGNTITYYQYYEVGDHVAREKVGQSLRDRLSNQYKSSTRSKRRRREALGAGITNEVEQMIQNNGFVCSRIKDLTVTATASILRHYTKDVTTTTTTKKKDSNDEQPKGKKNSNNDSRLVIDNDEKHAIKMFTKTNLDILEAFKLDNQLLEQFTAAESMHKMTFSILKKEC